MGVAPWSHCRYTPGRTSRTGGDYSLRGFSEGCSWKTAATSIFASVFVRWEGVSTMRGFNATRVSTLAI